MLCTPSLEFLKHPFSVQQSCPNNFFAKAIHLVMNMDKMIGGEFEKGLADMKAAVEAAPKR
jgi:hypothetical protein